MPIVKVYTKQSTGLKLCKNRHWTGLLAQVALMYCTTCYGPRSFAVAGLSTWNSLPSPLRNYQLSSSFRHELNCLLELIFISTLETVFKL